MSTNIKIINKVLGYFVKQIQQGNFSSTCYVAQFSDQQKKWQYNTRIVNLSSQNRTKHKQQ